MLVNPLNSLHLLSISCILNAVKENINHCSVGTANTDPRQELEVISAVTWYCAWQQNSMLFSLILDEGDHPVHVINRKGIFGNPVLVAMNMSSNTIVQIMLNECITVGP